MIKKVVLLLTLLLFVGCSSSSKLIYIKKFTFNVDKPKDWIEFSGPHSLLEFKPKNNGNVSFRANQLRVISPEKFDLEKFIERRTETGKRYFINYKSNKKKINFKRGIAYIFICTYENEFVDYLIKYKEVYYYYNNIVYVLTYGGKEKNFDKYINDVNQIVKSFKIKE